MGFESMPQALAEKGSKENPEQFKERAENAAKLAESKLIEKFGSLEQAREIAKQKKTWNGRITDRPDNPNWEIYERDKKAATARILLEQIDEANKAVNEKGPFYNDPYVRGRKLNEIEGWIRRADTGDFVINPTGESGPAFG
ncbi:MAG: hypothetical protein Q7S34_04110 [bacterium]|nr:hypothetical protein [bacterium]